MPTSPTSRKRAHHEPCRADALRIACSTEQQTGRQARVLLLRYRNLALKWHPLRCDEADAQSNFDEVSEAFEVLSDCESRLPPR